jgi:hypothetical protein
MSTFARNRSSYRRHQASYKKVMLHSGAASEEYKTVVIQEPVLHETWTPQ